MNFRRQHAIGKYVPDFCRIKKKLIIELDGSQHLEQETYDAERTEYFASLGYRVIRFWNHEVMNDINEVIRAIQMALEEPPPPAEGRGGGGCFSTRAPSIRSHP